jgi:anaerobic dimethyl sulfoxide reductase subunit A
MAFLATEQTERWVPFTCTLDCGSRCPLVAWVRNGEVVRVDTPAGEDTPERPRLIPCARGRASRRAHEPGAQRVLAPLRRSGPRGSGQFVVIPWSEALDEVADRLQTVRHTYGDAAVLFAGGAGSVDGRGFSGASAARRFFSFWGRPSQVVGNMSNHCARVAAAWMLGGVVQSSDRAALLQSRLILLWGNNPAENRMSPNTDHFIAAARDRGARVILLDPRLSDSGVLADEWVPVRPGTDVALIAAMAYVMEREDLADRAFIAAYTAGYAAYRRYLLGDDDGQPKSPAWAAPITGVPATTIERLARAYATERPAMLLAGWGPQRSLHGEQVARAFIALACLSGNVGLAGGGVASLGQREGSLMPDAQLPLGPHGHSRALNASVWGAEILSGELEPPVRLAYIVGSNLINRSPNTRANARALETLDYVVVHEPFLTPTTAYADLVLPITIDLERADLVDTWGHDGSLFYGQQATSPMGQARSDYQVFSELAERLGFAQEYTGGRDEADWLRVFLAETPEAERRALEGEGLLRADPAEPRIELADFRRDPSAYPLLTPSGRIEIESPQAAAYGLPAIPSYLPEPEAADGAYPLHLLTPHSKLRSNSCLHSNPWVQRLERHAVWLNPTDAAARGLAEGDLAEVVSPHGAIRLPAYVTARIMPGVACVYQGTWYRGGDDNEPDPGGCANVLTGHVTTRTGGPATHSARVQVRRASP